MITGSLKNKIDEIWNTFHSNGISEPFTVIQQITYLIFLKRLDEEQTLKEKKALRLNKPIEKPIYTTEQKEIRWSTFKQFDPDKMMEIFTTVTKERPVTAFAFIKNVGGENKQLSNYFKDARLANFSPYLLDKVVQQIDKLDMHDQDTKGDLYEYLLSKLSSAGTMGQFRTPRHIIRMMVEMINPTTTDTICDPAAGTAGFLVMTEEYLKNKNPEAFHNETFQEFLNNQMFTGIEFSSDMMQIAAMNLILHGIEYPRLDLVNALGDKNTYKDEFSVILANPPFNGKLDHDQVSASVLSLARTKDTELLFISLMLRMLKVGGRCAVVIPQGVLFNSGKAYQAVRKELVANQNLQAVINMPSGVFEPYAGVSTAILIFTKTNSGGTGKVWFYDMKAEGYSLDKRRAPVDENDIPDILQRWNALNGEIQNERTGKCFKVPVKEIEDKDWDLSINSYKEIIYKEIEYANPKELIATIKARLKQNEDDLKALEELIG